MLPSDTSLRARPGPTSSPGAGWLSLHLPAPRPMADPRQILDARGLNCSGLPKGRTLTAPCCPRKQVLSDPRPSAELQDSVPGGDSHI